MDVIIVSILQAVINAVFGSQIVTSGVVDPSATGGFSSYTSATTVGAFWLWIAAIAYFSLFEGLFGQTPGKVIVGIRVTDLAGRRAGWRAALIRNVLRVIDSFPGIYLLGALIARFSPLRQRLGDRLARTIVVPTRVATDGGVTEAERRRGLSVVLVAAALFIAGCAAFSYYGRPPIVVGKAARLGQLPGGSRVDSYSLGEARWNGSSVTYPIQYSLASGKSCTGHITLDWYGFFQGWQLTADQVNC